MLPYFQVPIPNNWKLKKERKKERKREREKERKRKISQFVSLKVYLLYFTFQVVSLEGRELSCLVLRTCRPVAISSCAERRLFFTIASLPSYLTHSLSLSHSLSLILSLSPPPRHTLLYSLHPHPHPHSRSRCKNSIHSLLAAISQLFAWIDFLLPINRLSFLAHSQSTYTQLFLSKHVPVNLLR